MLTTVFEAVGLVFMLFGMIFLLYIVFEKIITRRSGKKYFSVVPGYENDENLPEEVYAAFIESNLLNFVNRHEVVVLDFGVTEAVKNSCQHILGDDRKVIFCQPEDFSQIIGRLS